MTFSPQMFRTSVLIERAVEAAQRGDIEPTQRRMLGRLEAWAIVEPAPVRRYGPMIELTGAQATHKITVRAPDDLIRQLRADRAAHIQALGRRFRIIASVELGQDGKPTIEQPFAVRFDCEEVASPDPYAVDRDFSSQDDGAGVARMDGVTGGIDGPGGAAFDYGRWS